MNTSTLLAPAEAAPLASALPRVRSRWMAPSERAIAAEADETLLMSIVEVEELGRQVDIARVRYSAEVAHRSRRELGNAGLAAGHGHLSAEQLLKTVTRSSLNEASRRVRIGIVLAESTAATELGDEGPFAPIAVAVADGRLGVDGADQVIRTLTPIVDQVDPGTLAQATSTLATESATRDADAMGRLAPGVRDTLDRVGVIDRERYLRAQRSLRRGRVIDGLRKVTLILDPESDAIIMGAIDHAMSPRLGGPRFTDRARADQLLADDRTNEQLALDTLTGLVRIGVDADDGTLLGATKPALRVTISVKDLTRAVDAFGIEHPDPDTGIGWLEGSTEPVSAATARRLLCDVGALPIVLSGCSEPLDMGRTRRLFTRPQRIALANRDGGCRWPGCDRPSSWCEAHHLDPFNSDGCLGDTNLDNGVLLCRRHHLLLHDGGWHITHGLQPDELLLTPPATVDRDQTPRPMPTKLPPWLKSA